MTSSSIQMAARRGRSGFAGMGSRSILGIMGFILLSATTLSAATVNASVFSVKGTVEFAAPGSSDFALLKKGQVLAIGSTVRTGDDGVAVLVPTPGSAIQVGNDS